MGKNGRPSEPWLYTRLEYHFDIDPIKFPFDSIYFEVFEFYFHMKHVIFGFPHSDNQLFPLAD